MRSTALAAAVAIVGLFAPMLAVAEQPQTVRLRGVIEKFDGHTVLAKSAKGDELKLNLADRVIREGEFIGSGGMPQPDGSQKAIEVHIFAESMRGTGEGFRPWDGAPNSTMTNGTVGASVAGVDGPVITVKYKDGEKKITHAQRADRAV